MEAESSWVNIFTLSAICSFNIQYSIINIQYSIFNICSFNIQFTLSAICFSQTEESYFNKRRWRHKGRNTWVLLIEELTIFCLGSFSSPSLLPFKAKKHLKMTPHALVNWVWSSSGEKAYIFNSKEESHKSNLLSRNQWLSFSQECNTMIGVASDKKSCNQMMIHCLMKRCHWEISLGGKVRINENIVVLGCHIVTSTSQVATKKGMFPQSQICWWILILEIIFGESRAPCDWSHIADLSDVSCVEPLRTLPGPFINPTHLPPPPYTYVLLKIHIVLLFAHHGLFLLYHFKCTEKKHLLMRFCDDLRGREAVKAANSASTYYSTTRPIEEGKAHNMTLIDCNYIEVSAPNNNVARVNPPTQIHLVGVPNPLDE